MISRFFGWLVFFCALFQAAGPLQCQTDVLMQHNDIGRTGQNLTETTLTTANVNYNSFGKLYSVQLDGWIFAQPLYVSKLSIPSAGTHSVLFVATEHDSVYALDTLNGGSILWHASMLDAAHGAAAGATTDPQSDTGCTDTGPEMGLTGTPVIDRTTGTMYLVAETVENGYPIQRLHALDITTGAEKFGGPVAIQAAVPGTGDGSSGGILSFDPKWENQHAGLLLINGIVYIAWSSHCDVGTWHGWLMGYNAATLAQSSVFVTTPNGSSSGIWMSGMGLAADNINGNPRMFVPTGNGTFDNNQDYGDDVLKFNLSSGLQVADSFTPFDQLALNQADYDLASAGLVVLPDQAGPNPHLAVIIGKKGELYLLNRDNLGGYNSTADNVVQEFPTVQYFFGFPSYWNGSVYFWPTFDHLRQYTFTSGLLSTSPVATSGETSGFFGITQSISANQTQSGTGILWSVDWHQNPEVLYAHDAGNVANTLWNSGQDSTRDSAGASQRFAMATVADGNVFVPAQGIINVYGLLNSTEAGAQPNFSLAVAPSSVTLNPGSGANATVTLTSSNGYTGGVTVSASGLPNGVTASFVSNGNGSLTLTLTTTTATAAGTYAISINGASSEFTNTTTLNLTVNASAKYIPFISGQSPTTLRNNYSGFTGFKLTVGASPVTVSALGRFIAPGNSGTHLVKLVASDGTDVPGGSVSILANSAANQFQYANLAQLVTLSAKSSYYLVSQETAGGDQWYDIAPVTSNVVGTVNGPAYADASGNYVLVAGLAKESYVPVNFLYDSSTMPTSAAVTTPAAAASVSGKTAVLAAAIVLGQQLTLTSAQFRIDGVNAGAALTAAPYNTTFDSTQLSNGSHTAAVVVVDSGGAVTLSSAVAFTVNNSAAGTVVTAPAAGTTVTGKSVALAAAATPGVGLSIVSVQFKIDGANSGTALTAAPYTTTFDSTKLTDGAHTATANAVDSKGASTVSAGVTFLVNNAATSVVLTAPSSGAVASGSASPLAATVTAGGGLAIVSVQFKIDGANAGAAVTVSPYATTFDSTVLANGSHIATAVVLDSSGTSTISTGVTFSVNNAVTSPASTTLLSGFTAGTLRNNFSGYVGMEITTGLSSIAVTGLGRIYVAGNSGSHIVKLVNAGTGADVTGGSVNVTPSSGTAGRFTYVTLASPVTLAANTSYYLVSQETAAGDVWYDITPVTGATVATVAAPVYYNGSRYVTVPGLPNQSYVPVNFQYSSTASTAPSVAITSPAGGATVSGSSVAVMATASAVSGLSITAVQFSVDGAAIGSAVTVSPYSVTLNTKTLTNGAHTLTAVAQDSAGGTATSTPVTVSVSNGGSSAGTALLTGFTVGNPRNNFSGYVGMEFTVGSSALTVTGLGRIYVAGNGASHSVKLVNAGTGADVPGGSIAVAPSSGTAGQFTYASLASPVTLAANTSYYLMSLETSGGDQWYDITPVTATAVASVAAPVYFDGSKYVAVPGLPGQSYVPVNLQCSTVNGNPPTVLITSPAAGATVSGSAVSVTASASAAVGLSISSVQFQLDGTNVGGALNAAPYTTTFNSTSVTNGAHSLTAVATDSNGVASTSAAVTVNTSNVSAPSQGTPLLTGFTAGTLRNNFLGYVGMQLTVGSAAVSVTALGRVYVSGNTASHLVKLVNGSTGADVAGASVSIAPASGTAGQYTYVSLASPVTLSANASYYLVSLETSGGDKWYDITPVAGATAASVDAPVYFDGAKYVAVKGLPNQSYVPVNLQYSTAASNRPAVSVTSPIAGATLSGSSVSLAATATAAPGLGITSVQFYLDSVAIGGAVTASPYSVSVDTTTLANGTHSLTATAQDSAGAVATSTPVSVTVSNGGGTVQGTSMLTGFTPGTLRNNYSGYVGMQFTVLSAPITVTSLGRVYLSGNSGKHVLKLVVASTGADVPGSSVSLNLPSGTAGQFAYAPLSAPVTLPANTAYYLMSQETSGGDNWYDITGVLGTSAVSLDGPVYYNGFRYVLVTGAVSQSYGPLSIGYHF